MLHSRIRHREEVDSRLLVVGSQTINLTPGLSFAHNLGCRCLNDQCEAILDIHASRPFQWHQEHLNARCFGPCYWTLKLWESLRTPSPQLWECEFHPHTWPKWGCDIFSVTRFWLLCASKDYFQKVWVYDLIIMLHVYPLSNKCVELSLVINILRFFSLFQPTLGICWNWNLWQTPNLPPPTHLSKGFHPLNRQCPTLEFSSY